MTDLPEHKINYVEELVGDLTSYLAKPNLQSLVTIAAEEIQIAEDVAWACVAERLLETAEGAQLDQWGVVLNEIRGGLTDGEYRNFLKARILSNLSNGEPERLIQILKILTRAIQVQYQPLYPAGMAFGFLREVSVLSPASSSRIKIQMQQITGAGIAIYYITQAVSPAFGFLEDPDSFGFGEGFLSEVI